LAWQGFSVWQVQRIGPQALVVNLLVFLLRVEDLLAFLLPDSRTRIVPVAFLVFLTPPAAASMVWLGGAPAGQQPQVSWAPMVPCSEPQLVSWVQTPCQR
jgi:hypothetical protein